MTSPYDKERMYNADVKEQFLQTYENEQTQTTISYVFYNSKQTEEMLGKDLYEFPIEKIEEVLFETQPQTETVAVITGRFISQYINWAIGKGFLYSNINPLKQKDTDWYKRFVDKSKKLYYSEKEVMNVVKDLVNYQDKVLMLLPFEGVFGQGGSEILNLKISDINGNRLTLHDDKKGQREVEVSDLLIHHLEKANEEKEYYSKNGTLEAGQSRGRAITKLEDTGYICRSTLGGRESVSTRMDKHTIYRRLTIVSELFDYPYLTAKNLEKSGMIKMAKDLFLRDGELGRDQFKELGTKFNIPMTSSGDVNYPNTTALKGFINRENILKLYSIDIDAKK